MWRNAVSRGSVAAVLLFGLSSLIGPVRGPGPLAGQVTSPGELSVAHADWEGTSNCARCHEIDGRSTTAARCLSCHTPLAARIAAAEGYHATRVSDCASCHREHRGTAARPVRFEPAGFDHATIGYPLSGEHADLECAGCHNTRGVRDREVRLFKGRYGALTKTYLGLEQSCGSCHASRDPHAAQFEGRECAGCHDETDWTPAARFDHAEARYPLTGRHRTVECAGCHRERDDIASYRPLPFGECSSCHRDSHDGEMGARCARCHSTGGWGRIPRRRFEGDFDHRTTAFPLEGRHAAAACTACHRRRATDDPAISLTFPATGLPSYPRPEYDGCASCHLDAHAGTFTESALGPECASCHTERGWTPVEFDVFLHDGGAFPLSGAHRVVPCADCHAVAALEGDALEFRIRLGVGECASCHGRDDPHRDQFAGRPCEGCHATRSFEIEGFDHEQTRFPLDGAHASASCASCHRPEPADVGPPVVRYRPLDLACRACHGESTALSTEGAARERGEIHE